MNAAQFHVAAARDSLDDAVRRFELAAAAMKADPALKDMDARALAVARTNAETAAMWAERVAK